MRKLLARPKLVGLIAGCGLLFAPGAALAGTLDQQQTDTSDGNYGIESAQSMAQTFTAGITGGLDQVDLSLFQFGGTPSAPLYVEIRDVSGGAPGANILANQSVPPTAVSSSPSFVPIAFPSAAPVVAGTQYSIVAFSFASLGGGMYWLWKGSSNANSYPGGAAFNSSPPLASWMAEPPGSNELAFKTYVVPSTASTPSTASMATAPTGLRAAALAKCKKRATKHNWSKERLKKCKKKANLLPV
jgi:hypothetical protein